MKDRLIIGIALVLTALILGVSFVIGTSNLAKAITKKEMVISDKSLDKILLAIGSLKQTGQAPMPKMPEPGSKRVEGVTGGTNPMKGKSGAKVLLIEFSDFQCPFSKRFYNDAFISIQKEYIDTGKVKFAYRDYPLEFHPQAKAAAVAARCAGKQNKYWEMFEKLTHTNALDTQSLSKYAQEMELDMPSFDKCMANPEIAKAVDIDAQEALRLGVQGTPTFLINGRFVEGAHPFATFKKIIEEELGAKK